MSEKYLVTTALPYANGSIHLGHLLEGVQADIWVRFQKSIGNTCYFFCADDTHGTPIMIAARKEGISPEELVNRIHGEHYKDLTSFLIEYDNYYTTNSKENQYFSEQIYSRLKERGHILSKNIEQSYCEHDKMFLPDRFIKGTCPKCSAKDQYGDGCESCGGNYSPKDLIDSKCALCGNTPVLKESRHLFFDLPAYSHQLLEWLKVPEHVQDGVRKKLNEWFEAGLQPWDISRDGPYFGFKIPGEENKYFYVWLDAPIGYMASSQNYFQNNQREFDLFWEEGKGKIIHFIGKDILYFHALFFPAMLMGANYHTPDSVYVHGFITVNGEKMSKSRGTFIKASTFLKHQDPEHFRFYVASKLNDSLEDLDFSFEDYISKVNSDLIGNLVNIVSRVSTSILDKLDRKLGKLTTENKQRLQELLEFEPLVRKCYQERNYSKAIKEITKAGDLVNRHINDAAPWNLIKVDPEKTREVVTYSLNAAKILAVYFAPVLPQIANKIFILLGLDPKTSFLNLKEFLEDTKVLPYTFLSSRVNEKAIAIMVEESKVEQAAHQSQNQTQSKVAEVKNTEGSGLISIQELSKVELRVGLIKEAYPVEGADKLLNLKVDLGEKGIKNVFAGIKAAYKPEDLIGKKVVTVANLEPRKMKFGVSEAMLMASGKESSLSLFVPDRDANPGDLLK